MLKTKKYINSSVMEEVYAYSFILALSRTLLSLDSIHIKFWFGLYKGELKVNKDQVCVGGFRVSICGREIYTSITQPVSPPR